MWVRQQRALQAPDPDLEPLSNKAKSRGEASALMALLSDEIVDAAGSGAAGDVAARVSEALGDLVQGVRDGPKKNGPYDLALKARDAARAAVVRAREAADMSEARLVRIATLQRELAEFEDRARVAGHAQRIKVLEQAIAQAASQRARTDLARAEATARRLEAETARNRVAKIEADVARRREVVEALETARRLQERSRELAAAINANAATPVRLNALDTSEAFVLRRGALLMRQGYDVMGAFLRLGTPDGVESDADACKIDPVADPAKPISHKQGCCSVNDAADARRVSALLGIPFYVLNFQDDFSKIIDYS